MPTFNFTDNDGLDIGNKYVTKEYLIDVYPNLIPAMASPQLWTWGKNNSDGGYGSMGVLGDNTTINGSSPGTTAGTTTTWKQASMGGNHSAAIKSDGTLWTWGHNNQGGLGDSTSAFTSRSSPGTTSGGGTNWLQVSAGWLNMAAIKTDGTLWTWGYDGYGTLGAGTNNTARSSPGTTAGGGTNWKQVSASAYHMAAIKTDGTLWTWGFNGSGRLGDGTTTTRSSPGTTAGGGTNWKFVSVSKNTGHSGALKSDGTLWTWGDNTTGQLGDGTTTNRSSPGTTAGGGTNWKDVSCSATDAFNSFMAGIKTDGTLWTWGYNTTGQLGAGAIPARSSPGTTSGGGTNWKNVSCGYSSMIGLKTDGTLWNWGYNIVSINISSPATVNSSTTWKSISAGKYHFAAISEMGNW